MNKINIIFNLSSSSNYNAIIYSGEIKYFSSKSTPSALDNNITLTNKWRNY